MGGVPREKAFDRSAEKRSEWMARTVGWMGRECGEKRMEFFD